MNELSIEAKGAVGAASEPPAETRAAGTPLSGGPEGLGAADCCRLAEECFHLAVVAKDPAAAARLIETGNDYMRQAAAWLADQLPP
jgi:hypothetical protein